jgi:hypothetical protein
LLRPVVNTKSEIVLLIDTPAPPWGSYLEPPDIQEIDMVVWHIVKGFNPSMIAELSIKTE